jgi:hypothetical protein
LTAGRGLEGWKVGFPKTAGVKKSVSSWVEGRSLELLPACQNGKELASKREEPIETVRAAIASRSSVSRSILLSFQLTMQSKN